ncbi:MAG: M16 family metallopeptidase [Spirochaetota bacterium]
MPEKMVLDNGARLLVDRVPASESVSCGIWIDLGSRDEDNSHQGMTHFIEHMLFRGTTVRSYSDIATEIDSIGGEINGGTGKETTHYYVNTAADYYTKALEVLIDMYKNPAFRESDFEKERDVILEEIEMGRDNYDEYVEDIFSSTLWNGCSFGAPIIGEKQKIQSLSRSSLINYYRSGYTPETLIISVAGKVEPLDVAREVQKHLKEPENRTSSRNIKRTKPEAGVHSTIINRDIEQVYFMCGKEGYSYRHPCRYPMILFNMIVGGSLSSRLFQKIREKKGLCYAISSSASSYTDTGEFTVEFSTSLKNLPLVLDSIAQEFESIQQGRFKNQELELARNRFKGSYILARESMEWKMARMAVHEIVFGRFIPYEETIEKINNVTMDHINTVACDLINPNMFSFACIGPPGQENCLKECRFPW